MGSAIAMNTGSLVEFLGNVPLLQKLLSSSLKKIADVVLLKRYVKGDYVIREDEAWDGCYFIFSGEAQVSEPAEEENRSEFLLKQYDYFGHGISRHVHSADIVAMSELTCLVLPRDHCCLLETNSIWQLDTEIDKCSLVERILHLDPLEVIFNGAQTSSFEADRQVFMTELLVTLDGIIKGCIEKGDKLAARRGQKLKECFEMGYTLAEMIPYFAAACPETNRETVASMFKTIVQDRVGTQGIWYYTSYCVEAARMRTSSSKTATESGEEKDTV